MVPNCQVARVARILAASAVGMMVVLGVVAVTAFTGDDAPARPPLWLLAAQVGLGIVLHVAIDVMGYRGHQAEPGVRPEVLDQQEAAAVTSTTPLRMAFAELPAVLSIAWTAASDGGVATYAGGGVVSVVLLLVHVWPWARPRRRLQRAVRPPGAIQEL